MLNEVANLLDSVAWPLAVLAAVIILRRPIAGLLERRITVKKGETSVQIEAVAALSVEEAATELASPAVLESETGEPLPPEEQAARRQAQVERLLAAAATLGWAAGSTGEDRPPRHALDWSKEGRALVRDLRGDVTSEEGWAMVKARLAVRLEDPSLTDEQRVELVDRVREAHEEAVRHSRLK